MNINFDTPDWVNDNKNVIIFHSASPEYGWLYNLATFTIEDSQGLTYPSVEAFFQAHKYSKRENSDILMSRFTSATAQSAKRMGGKRGIPMTPDELTEWIDGRRVEVMIEAIRKKFSDMNTELKNKLIATGDKILIEKLPRFADAFWGVQKNGGANVLGQIIMLIREELNH